MLIKVGELMTIGFLGTTCSAGCSAGRDERQDRRHLTRFSICECSNPQRIDQEFLYDFFGKRI